MTNRIIVPANFSFEVLIKLDPVKGISEFQIRNRSGMDITMWQVVGLLVEHTAHITKSLLTTGKVKQTPVVQKCDCSCVMCMDSKCDQCTVNYHGAGKVVQ